jgi:hypothetical protein
VEHVHVHKGGQAIVGNQRGSHEARRKLLAKKPQLKKAYLKLSLSALFL